MLFLTLILLQALKFATALRDIGVLQPNIKLANSCKDTIEVTQGPYWVEENIEASNLRSNLSHGIPLTLILRIVESPKNPNNNQSSSECLSVVGARVDLWQCRYDGKYSDEDLEGTEGETWLRGYQITNSSGYAIFKTIYPGWYTTRTVHIHLRLRNYSLIENTILYEDTTQLYFDDSISDEIFANVYPYNLRDVSTRDTYNNNDSLFDSRNLLALDGSYKDFEGYSSYVELKLPLYGKNHSYYV